MKKFIQINENQFKLMSTETTNNRAWNPDDKLFELFQSAEPGMMYMHKLFAEWDKKGGDLHPQVVDAMLTSVERVIQQLSEIRASLE